MFFRWLIFGFYAINCLSLTGHPFHDNPTDDRFLCCQTLMEADSNSDGYLEWSEYLAVLLSAWNRLPPDTTFSRDTYFQTFSQRFEIAFHQLEQIQVRYNSDRQEEEESFLGLCCLLTDVIQPITTMTQKSRNLRFSNILARNERIRATTNNYNGYCFVAMTLSDDSYHSDGLLDGIEYINFLNILSSQSFHCITKLEDLPKPLLDYYLDVSSNGVIPLMGARPTDQATAEDKEFLIEFCAQSNRLVTETEIRSPCNKPSLSPIVGETSTLVEFNALRCFLSLAQANQDGNSLMDRSEYVSFVFELSGGNAALQSPDFYHLPLLLRINFSQLLSDKRGIDISGSEIGSSPTREQLIVLKQICNATNQAIHSTISRFPSPINFVTQPPSTPVPFAEAETTTSPTTESTFLSESPTSMNDYQNSESSKSPTYQPSQASNLPSEIFIASVVPSNMASSSTPSMAQSTNASPELSIFPTPSSDAPSTDKSALPTLILTSIPSSTPSKPTREPTKFMPIYESVNSTVLDAINYFLISRAAGKSTLTSEEIILLSSAYNELAENVTYETLESTNEVNSLLKRNSIGVSYVPMSGQITNFNETKCPATLKGKIICHYVTAGCKLSIAKGTNVKSVLEEITSAISMAIQRGKLEALLEKENSEISIDPFPSILPSPSPIIQSPSNGITYRFNESVYNVSISFVASNLIGISASGFVSGTVWYLDILLAFEHLVSRIITNSTIDVKYITSSSKIEEVVDVMCSSSQIGAFCQSFIVLFQILAGTRIPESAIREIVKSIDLAIDSGQLQSELDSINSESVYQIDEGYEAERSQLTLSPSAIQIQNNTEFDDEKHARKKTYPGTIYVAALAGSVMAICVIAIFMYSVKSNRRKIEIKDDGSSDADHIFGASGTLNDNHTGDTWHDGDEYYEQEYQYDTSPEQEAFRKSSLASTHTTTLTSTFASNASRSDDEKFSQVFGTGDIDWGLATTESLTSQQILAQKLHLTSKQQSKSNLIPSQMNSGLSGFHNAILEEDSGSSSGESSSGESSSGESSSNGSSSGSNNIGSSSSSSSSGDDTSGAD